MTTKIRTARAADVDALVALENGAFETDRLSRRSFRWLIAHETADAIVLERDEEIAGYAIVLYRNAAATARLYSIAVDSRHRGGGLGGRLLDVAESQAYDHGKLFMRLEVREDNKQAIELYTRRGYREIGRVGGYYEDGMAARRFEMLLRGSRHKPSPVPYYEQVEDFTCGPCCLMMAMGYFDPRFVPDPVMEIRLWRESTTVFMMSGPGGCEPWGLAVAARDHGLKASILVSDDNLLFLQSVRSEEKRRVMALAQRDFRARAATHEIPVEVRDFVLDDILAGLDRGQFVCVLVSGYMMFDRKVPHWVLVIGHDDGHVFIHDPWVEDEREETATDAANIPVSFDIFMRMARFGSGNLRAAVFLWKDRQ